MAVAMMARPVVKRLPGLEKSTLRGVALRLRGDPNVPVVTFVPDISRLQMCSHPDGASQDGRLALLRLKWP